MTEVSESHDTPPQEQPAVEPVPPQKPPTLASMIVESMREIARSLREHDSAAYSQFCEVRALLTAVQVLVIIALGIACLGVLLGIAELAMLAYLLGRVR